MGEEPTLLSDVLVELASLTAEPFDVAEFLHLATERACQLISADGAIVLLSLDGAVMAPAGSSGDVGDIDALLAYESVPCRMAMQTGEYVAYAQETGHELFPDYTALAVEAEVHRVLAVPLRHRKAVLGTLSMVRKTPSSFTPDEIEAAHQIADVVAASVVREQAHRAALAVSAQLQHALEARVVVEQAKGMVAAELGISIDDALDCIRQFTRRQQLRLADVADDIVKRKLPIALLRS